MHINCDLHIRLDVQSALYHSGNTTNNYYDAQAICQNFGGDMLDYGKSFIDTMLQCQVKGYVWSGLPFYNEIGKCWQILKSKPFQVFKID